MSIGSIALLLRPPTMLEMRPLDKPNGNEIGTGYTGSIGDMIDAMTGNNAFAEVIVFDVSINEDHGASADIPAHPLESGSEITDHLKNKPDTLSVQGLITDTPLETIVEAMLTKGVNWSAGSFTTLTGNAPKSVEKWLKLKAMKEAGTVFNIVTGVEVYKNMMIAGLSTSRNRSTGRALIINVEFRKVSIVDTDSYGDDGTEPEVDLGALAVIKSINPILVIQAATMLGLIIYGYAENE